MVLIQTYLNDIKTDVKSNIVLEFTYVDFGSDDTTPTAADTAMGNSIVRNIRQQVLNLSDDVVVSGFLNSAQGNGNDIKEIGIFDASTGGIMKVHSLMTSVAKTVSKEIWVDVRTTVSVTQPL